MCAQSGTLLGSYCSRAAAAVFVPLPGMASHHLGISTCFLGLQLNDAPLAIVDKRRSSHNVSEVMNLIGDVKDKVAVLVDDMIDTAGTITNAAKVSVLMQQF